MREAERDEHGAGGDVALPQRKSKMAVETLSGVQCVWTYARSWRLVLAETRAMFPRICVPRPSERGPQRPEPSTYRQRCDRVWRGSSVGVPVSRSDVDLRLPALSQTTFISSFS